MSVDSWSSSYAQGSRVIAFDTPRFVLLLGAPDRYPPIVNPTIRQATASDEPFLREMLYIALFVPPGKPPFPKDVVDEPSLARYVDEFGDGISDIGFIAENDGRRVGAAWVRQLTEDDPGYGFVDGATPELSIAVLEEWRGRGVGTQLMEALLAAAPHCSLSVDRRNPAVRLYERLGFLVTATDADSVTMVRVGDQSIESALVVPVPAAEPVVGRLRAKLDAGAQLGLPAHVTVLYPFAPPSQIDTPLIDRLRALFAQAEAFPVEFNEVGWFGDRVAWRLAPEPSDRFHRLTRLVTDRWPEYPPYGGAHGAVVAHLTIGDTGSYAALQQAATQAKAGLPICDTATEVRLMAGSSEPASWRTVAVFRLPDRNRGAS
jgi:GNAT superfamily N-acetyltransferase/2'-5' RNA ligase